MNDDVEEEVERFLLELSDPSNAQFGDSSGAATILDDDGLIQILIDDAAATVYEAAGASVSFAVRLSRADPDAAVTVDYATEDATALAGDDYTHTDTDTSDPLMFAAGETDKTVVVDLVDDDIAEDTETFRLGSQQPEQQRRVPATTRPWPPSSTTTPCQSCRWPTRPSPPRAPRRHSRWS